MDKIHDPYGGCETDCTHDLAHGVLTNDLNDDGPYPDSTLLLGTGWLADRIAEAGNRQGMADSSGYVVSSAGRVRT